MINDFNPNEILQGIIKSVIEGEDTTTLYELDGEYAYKKFKPSDEIAVRPLGDSDNSHVVFGTVLRTEEKYGFEKIFVMSNNPELNIEFDDEYGRPFFTIVSR